VKRTVLPIIIILVFLFVPLLSLSASGAGEAPETAVSVQDSLGRQVDLPGVPERIVLAGKAVIMLADAVYLFPGAGERVIAVGNTNQGLGDFFPVLDPAGGEKQVLGKDPGAEEVARLNPDLVILKTSMKSGLGSSLEALGLPVVYLSLETPEEYTRDLAILGTLLGQSGRSRELEQLFRNRLEDVRSSVEGRGTPSALVLNYTERGGSYSFAVAPESWIQSSQVVLAGGRPVWYQSAVSPGWNQVQFEQIAAWDPDRIIILSYQTPTGEVLERLRSDSLWSGLRAVREGHLAAFPSDFYSWGQPDTRWILGVEWMARTIHPELRFGETAEARAQAFFRDFYGLDESVFREKIRPVLQGSFVPPLSGK